MNFDLIIGKMAEFLASYFMSLYLGLHIYKMGIITPTSFICNKIT